MAGGVPATSPGAQLTEGRLSRDLAPLAWGSSELRMAALSQNFRIYICEGPHLALLQSSQLQTQLLQQTLPVGTPWAHRAGHKGASRVRILRRVILGAEVPIATRPIACATAIL